MLNGQTALVTGASRGIGHAIALELGKMGARVIGTATSSEGAATISRYLEAANIGGEGTVRGYPVEALIAHAEKRYGPVSILVNNAGITRDNLSMRMKDNEWDEVLDINLKGVFRLSKAVMRGMMKARQGRIVNITSVVGHSGNPGLIDTDMTKHLDEAHRTALVAAIPLGRLGSPEDVAAAVGFLVSPAAAYITGVTIHVNGGMYMD